MIDVIYDNSVCWQMSPHERASILYLIDSIPKKSCAVEIGSYKGGFLRQLVKHFDAVHSVDLDHRNLVKSDYTNVEFHTGPGADVLPDLIPALHDATFFLIDANHEYDYVRQDLANVLRYVPTSTTYVLVHDSWYKPSRQALLATEYPSHVHFVDLDYTSGEWTKKQWMGGLALIQLLPQERAEPLAINQTRRKCPHE